MAYNPLDPSDDPFGPPEVSVEVECLHCGQQYESYRIVWRIETDADGNQHGFWCCPIPDCDGKGFGFDIFPIDPDYHDERGGWIHCDEDCDEEDYDEDEFAEDNSSDGATDQGKHGGNGHGKPKIIEDWSDDIPF
jgi:hypothetical protein